MNISLFIFITSTVLLSSSFAYDNDGDQVFTVEHRLNGKDFTTRGDFSLERSKTAVFSQDGIMSLSDVALIKNLATNGELYTVRIGRNGKYMTASIQACLLVESYMTDTIALNIDHMGNVMGFTMYVEGSSYCKGKLIKSESLRSFATTMNVQPTATGPVPEPMMYQKGARESHSSPPEGNGDPNEEASKVDNRSFIAKYWMYIVPLLLFVMFSSAADPQQAAPAK